MEDNIEGLMVGVTKGVVSAIEGLEEVGAIVAPTVGNIEGMDVGAIVESKEGERSEVGTIKGSSVSEVSFHDEIAADCAVRNVVNSNTSIRHRAINKRMILTAIPFNCCFIT